jgi:hypothetical protein
MMNLLVLCTAVGSISTGAGFVILKRLSRFTERTVYDVPDLLRNLDERSERILFDAQEEVAIRTISGVPVFRRRQHYYLDLAAEIYCSRYHNQRIVLDWMSTEHYDINRYHSEDEYGGAALQQMETALKQGRKFCRLAMLIIFKIRVLSLLLYLDRFNVLHVPSVASLRHMGNVDMPELYREVKKAVVAFARVYGEDQSRLIETRL